MSTPLAQALELDILLERGIHAACGCTKFIMCNFPGTSWYYATVCRHEESAWPPDWDFWWYNLSEGCPVYVQDFESTHFDATWYEPDDYVRTRAGLSLFYIRMDGRVWNVTSGRMRGGVSGIALWK